MVAPKLLRTTALLTTLALAVASAGCRREESRLDNVQKMAYGVKPAVVRVNAYSTAQFLYSTASLQQVEKLLRESGFAVSARAAGGPLTVETGAGGSGSGFIIDPSGYILTSGHVVTPLSDVEVMKRELLRNGAIAALVDQFPVDTLRTLYRGDVLDRYINLLTADAKLEQIQVVREVELSNGVRAPYELRTYSPPLGERGTDIAVLKIERSNLPTLQLGDSDLVHLQEPIWVIGYPAVASTTDEVIGGWLSRESDLEATFNPGTITSLKRDVSNTPVFQTNVAIYRGNSGGPAVDRDGKVIGISTWGHTAAEQIKFLVPINLARTLLAQQNVPVNVEGAFNEAYRSALDAAWEGDWASAREDLARANRLFPNSPDLIRFMRDADRSLRNLPFWQTHPRTTSWVAVILSSLTVLLILGFSRRHSMAGVPIASERLVAPSSRVTSGGENAERSSTLFSERSLQSLLGKFTILNGDRAGERLGLGGSGIRIGRESTMCEIVFENPKVSRLHAEVVSIDGRVLLIDRNSSNGTFVNDQKIDRRFLNDGDIIYFGGRNAIAVAFHA